MRTSVTHAFNSHQLVHERITPNFSQRRINSTQLFGRLVCSLVPPLFSLPMARALFSKTCIDVPGSSAEEVAKQLRDQPRLVTKGLCDSSLEHHQARHIRLTYSPPPHPCEPHLRMGGYTSTSSVTS